VACQEAADESAPQVDLGDARPQRRFHRPHCVDGSPRCFAHVGDLQREFDSADAAHHHVGIRDREPCGAERVDRGERQAVDRQPVRLPNVLAHQCGDLTRHRRTPIGDETVAGDVAQPVGDADLVNGREVLGQVLAPDVVEQNDRSFGEHQ